ncbi:hypothetical protein [Ensifer sesbaniae]|uniref:hypothetical protein n=1 Tax=Ensifer sesbaniae TaxID=1214071 RepID=UPI001569DD2F|nr:hypothetical protein [Ensifer sesbaniae]NRQ13493.1 hypothetical protein [Ensifer sesbaniae]
MTLLNRRSVLGGIAVLVAPPVAAQSEQVAFDLQNWIETADPQEVASYLAEQLAATMRRANPGRSWRSVIEHEHSFVLICGDPV